MIIIRYNLSLLDMTIIMNMINHP